MYIYTYITYTPYAPHDFEQSPAIFAGMPTLHGGVTDSRSSAGPGARPAKLHSSARLAECLHGDVVDTLDDVVVN